MKIKFKTIASVSPVITSGFISGIFEVPWTNVLIVLFFCLHKAKTVIKDRTITIIDVVNPNKNEFTNAKLCDFEKSSL